MTRSLETHTIVWRGVTIEIRYEEQWLGSDGPFSTAHLELHVLSPEKAPLPVTDTGYRSHSHGKRRTGRLRAGLARP